MWCMHVRIAHIHEGFDNFMHKIKFKMHSVLEMQRYIDILSYRDTLGSDTVLIHI